MHSPSCSYDHRELYVFPVLFFPFSAIGLIDRCGIIIPIIMIMHGAEGVWGVGHESAELGEGSKKQPTRLLGACDVNDHVCVCVCVCVFVALILEFIVARFKTIPCSTFDDRLLARQT